MTTSAPIPATQPAPRMANSPDTTTKAQRAASAPTLRSQVAENPLMSFFCLLIVALLAAAIASPHIRIDDTNRRLDRLDARMTAGFAAVDARFDEVEEEVDTRFDEVDTRFDEVDARFDEVDARFATVDARFDEVDARFATVDARFDEVDARFDEIDLKLTVLIVGLGAADHVNAAIGGRLDGPGR